MSSLLPSDAAAFSGQDWTENVPRLLSAVLDTAAARLDKTTKAATFVQARLTVLDQHDNEIYFPVVKLKNPDTGEIKEEVTAFRESIHIPDGFDTVDEEDFSRAKDRNCYVVSMPLNSTPWATEYWRTSEDPHNKDKDDFADDDMLLIKVYSKETLKVLDTYTFRGIFYPKEESSSKYQGVIHVIELQKAQRSLPKIGDMSGLYDDLVALLEQALFGDVLAAKFVASALVSRVYLRKDELVLGCFCLNLNVKGFPPEVAVSLQKLLCLLTESFKHIPFTIANLNSRPFNPVKDYDKEQLVHSELSVSPKTVLLIDETKIASGNLTAVGTKNVGMTSELIENQQIIFDYQFYQKNFDTDVTCITLSNGKSLLPSTHSVKVATKLELADYDDYFERLLSTACESGVLPRLRDFIGHCKALEYDVADEEMVQNFIVETRKADEKIGIAELHKMLVLGRTLCLSRGIQVATLEYLEEAREMMKKLHDRN